MIAQELGKLKRRLIMRAIEMMALGIIMIICPEEYVVTMIGTFGSLLVIASILGVFEYLESEKNLVDYISLTVALLIGIAGTVIEVFEVHSFVVISIIFGIYLILNGLFTGFNAMSHQKRNGRVYWQSMCFLGITQIVCGVIILAHPWWDTYVGMFNAVGCMLLYSAFVSILLLAWIWPGSKDA